MDFVQREAFVEAAMKGHEQFISHLPHCNLVAVFHPRQGFGQSLQSVY